MRLPELRTLGQIKKALGKDGAQILRQLDGSMSERKQTQRAAAQLERFQPPLRCWACGSLKGQDSIAKIERAHVFPINEGGQTSPENLIPLCRRSKRKFAASSLGQILPSLGCHDLVEYGMLSRTDLIALQANLTPDPFIRSRLEKTAKGASSEILDTHVRKDKVQVKRQTMQELERGLACSTDPTQKLALISEAASDIRRAWDQSALSEAEKVLNKGKAIWNENILPRERSIYFYQKGYIESLKGLTTALNSFRLSAQFARQSKGPCAALSAAISEAQRLVVRVAWEPPEKLRGPVGARLHNRWLKLRDIFMGFRQDNCAAPESKSVATRWVQTALIHRARLDIKRGQFRQAERALREWELFRRTLDASSGWTIAMVPVANVSLGLIGVYSRLRRDRDDMIRRLCLGTRIMIWDPRKAPEGIKDALYAVARVLGRMRKKKMARLFKGVASRVVDHLSLGLK